MSGTTEEELDAAAQNFLKNKVDKHQEANKPAAAATPPGAPPPAAATPPVPATPPAATPATPPAAITEITVSPDKVIEITDKIKTENEGKTEEELKTLTDTAIAAEKEVLTTAAHEASSAEAINEKIEEVKLREENKDKTPDEILTIATKEISSLEKDGGSPPPAPAGSEGQKTIDELLSTKTDGKHKSIDELIAAAEKPAEQIQLSDKLQKLYDLEKDGADVDKVFAFNRLGIDNLDPTNFEQAIQLLKIKMKLDDDSMTDADMNHQLSKKFDLVHRYAEDDEEKENPLNKDTVDMEQRSVIREATATKSDLEKTKEKYLLPESGATSQAAAEVTRKKLAEMQDAWNGKVEASLTGYDAITVKVGEGMDFRFQLDTDKLTSLKEVVADPVKQFLGMFTKDGVTDIAKLQQAVAIIQNLDDYHSKLWEQAEDSGALKLVKRTSKLKTETVPAAGNGTTDAKYKTPAHQMVAGLKDELGIK